MFQQRYAYVMIKEQQGQLVRPKTLVSPAVKYCFLQDFK